MKENSVSKGLYQEISKQCIVDDLRRIGVQEGDHVAVVLSLKSIGHVVGGPKTFIEALLDVVGPKGTIMMNTYTRSFPLSEVAEDYVFNYKSTPCSTGIVPETLRKWPNAIRSKNPMCSVTAVGELAKYLTEGHDEHANLYAPYSKLAAVDGKYLCVGLKDNLVAIRHEAQHLAGLSDVVMMFWGVKFFDDSGNERVYAFNAPPCPNNLPSLVPELRSSGILRVGKLGLAATYMASARQLLDGMTKMLTVNPRLTLCDRVSCLWCREAERKLRLYLGRNGGRYFQKDHFVVTILRLINMFRVRRFLFLSFESGQGYLKYESNHTLKGMFSSFLSLCYLAAFDMSRQLPFLSK